MRSQSIGGILIHYVSGISPSIEVIHHEPRIYILQLVEAIGLFADFPLLVACAREWRS